MYHADRPLNMPARLLQPGWFGCALTLMLALGLGCAASVRPTKHAVVTPVTPPAPSFDVERPFVVPGEVIAWDLTYLGVTGGFAQLAVGEPGTLGSRRVVAMRAEARTIGLAAVVKRIEDLSTSWVDLDSGLPLRSEADAQFGARHLEVATTWLAAERRIDQRLRIDHGREQRRLRVLPDARVHDALSSLLVLRAWRAPAGEHATLTSLGGQRLWRTELVAAGRTAVDGPLGERSAFRIDGTAWRLRTDHSIDPTRPPRTFSVWISDDADRIPLRVVASTELGDVTISATAYTVGARVGAR